MANPEHLEIIKQGVGVWNKWRLENPFINPDLDGADLSNRDLGGILINLADRLEERPQFNRVNFSGSNLSWGTVRETDLVDANFMHAVLNRTDLSAANLTGVNFNSSSLIGAKFCYANLSEADLVHALVGSTEFGATNLRNAIGLSSCIHFLPSVLDFQTISQSGALPLEFLRGCGLPDTLIEYIPSLLNEPIQFYTCFISFTEADDAFSERLYNDLQAKGVRCWRWKEDAKWGKTLMRSIDEAVHVYDKLIVICSEQSLNSPAVIREIERALQREDDLARQGKEGEVLFPIRLDDYIFTGWQHHRKADVTAKHIGDFRRWKDHDSYTTAFERLLRDLKAGA